MPVHSERYRLSIRLSIFQLSGQIPIQNQLGSDLATKLRLHVAPSSYVAQCFQEHHLVNTDTHIRHFSGMKPHRIAEGTGNAKSKKRDEEESEGNQTTEHHTCTNVWLLF